MKAYAVTIMILSFRTVVVQAESAAQAAEIGQQEWLARPGSPVEPSAGKPYMVRPLEPLPIAAVNELALEVCDSVPPEGSKKK